MDEKMKQGSKSVVDSDNWISKHLGMDPDEILRLKQITGLASLFKDHDFSEAWEPDEQLIE
ncbi:hypothetical protein EfmAA290_17600 [Enterococcus faecium]|nr:hypothetical protein EfmAA290_17600 [Enterococcus faecium]